MLAVPSPSKAAKVAENPRFVTSLVLRALVTLAPEAGDTFTHAKLAAALPAEPLQRRRRGVLKLVQLGFVTSQRSLVDGEAAALYSVTAEGAAAVQAVAQGAVLMSGRNGQHPTKPGHLPARLWGLMRIRKLLSADEAVQLLADAGDPHYASKLRSANLYLRTWAANGVLGLAAKRGPRGQKTYVLLSDPGPAVPTVRKAAAA